MIVDPIIFLQFEENQNLYEKTIEGVHYWPLIRVEIYEYIVDIQLKHKDRHPDLVKNKKPNLNNIVQLLKSSVMHSRSPIVENKILLSAAVSKRNRQVESLLELDKKAFVYLNRPSGFKHEIGDPNIAMIYPDFRELMRGVFITISRHNPFLKRKVEREIADLVIEIENKLGVRLDLKRIVDITIYAVVSIKVLYPFFQKVLKRWKPSKVLLSPYYEKFNFALVKTAKEYGIPVYEYQHGELSRYHIAYNYLKIHEEYLPDFFLFFGEYWKDIITFPEKERIIVTGSLALDEKINQLKMTNSITNMTKGILFISQGPYTDYLYPFAVSLADLFEKKGINYKIYYKLHPNEVNTWTTLHKDYQDGRIILETENLYDIIDKVNYQIGINSTAIFEGVAFNLTTLILDCEFLDESDMRNFCEKGFGQLVSSPEEAANIILSQSVSNVESCYFWQSNARQAFRKQLDIRG